MICVLPNLLRSSKSLSPVIRCEALPSFDSDNKKLSFGSRQIVAELLTSINSPCSLIRNNNSSKSEGEKYLLNFGRCATSINSSSSLALNNNIKLGVDTILSNGKNC